MKLVLTSLVLLFVIDALLNVCEAVAVVKIFNHVFYISVHVVNEIRIYAFYIWLDGVIFVGQD